ncbi:MAG: aldehyde dehydrogenase family protein [Proteobacteria bacterium]|nr:aldehyde dehydrogenase family protein [Pseudomonadota bacterium]HQR03346.1 aldehyde dehydrogenase family protein [Rhodocyclaceae bacterium]
MNAPAETPLSEATVRFLAQPKKMLIGAEWRDALSGRTLESRNPATGDVIATFPAAAAADVDLAVQAARAAFSGKEWGKARPIDRERWLLRLADRVEANAQELAEIETLDNGKPLMFARRVDVQQAVDFLRYVAGWCTKIEGSTLTPSVPALRKNEYFAYTLREPVGVVGAIIPWNFPLLIAVWKIAPALATGCTIVLKPAEETSLAALRLAELVLEAGIPAGVVNVVTGLGHEAGAALAAHRGIDKVTFTGSTEVGKRIGKAAMDNMTRVSLELGGKSPVIMFDDVDVKSAAAGAANAIFFNSGQVCAAGSRLYVHKRVFDQVLEGVVAVANKMRVGPGLDPGSQIGPLVSAKQLQRVTGYIRKGVEEGGSLLAGSAESADKGYFIKPTVVTGLGEQATLIQEEIFGPVLVATPFDDIDEIAAAANATPYGLAASIWSNDLSRVHRLIPRIQAGTVWVNCHGVLDNAMPFGGYKQSGIGREMGRSMIDLFTETKSVMMQL